MMTRRSILGLLAGAVLDPERLLYTPGKKLISIPAPPRLVVVTYMLEQTAIDAWFNRYIELKRCTVDTMLASYLHGPIVHTMNDL